MRFPKDYLRLRRERIERGKWAAAGLEYCKGKSLQREILKAQTREITGHVSAAASSIEKLVTTTAANMKAHIDDRLGMKEGESTEQAKKRLRLQLSAVMCMEAHDKEAKRARET